MKRRSGANIIIEPQPSIFLSHKRLYCVHSNLKKENSHGIQFVISDFVSLPVYKPGNEPSYWHTYQLLLTYLVQWLLSGRWYRWIPRYKNTVHDCCIAGEWMLAWYTKSGLIIRLIFSMKKVWEWGYTNSVLVAFPDPQCPVLGMRLYQQGVSLIPRPPVSCTGNEAIPTVC